MKLATLKLTNLNLINQEIEQFEDIMKSNVLFKTDLLITMKKNYENDLIQDYLNYREMIGQRISELDEFIKLNKKDVRIPNFDRAKIRLKQIYNNKDYESFMIEDRKENEENKVNIQRVNPKGNQLSNYRKLSGTEAMKNKSNSRNQGNVVFDKNKNRSISTMNEKKLNCSMTSIDEQRKRNYENKRNGKGSVGKYNSVDEDMDISSGIFKKKPNLSDFKSKQSSNINNQSALSTFNMVNDVNWREVIFKLKMTEQEYNILIKEKSKIISK